MTRENILCVKFGLKEVTPGGEFEGLGSAFGNIDDGFDVVEPGAFKQTLGEKMPAMLWQHDPSKPLGVWESAKEVGAGLHVRGRLALDTQLGAEAHALLKMGALNGLSIGFMIPPGGSTYDDNRVRHIKQIDLWEISVVTFPMNRDARISAIKAMHGYKLAPTRRQAERVLRDAGFSGGQAEAILKGGYEALAAHERDTDGTDLLAAINAARGIL